VFWRSRITERLGGFDRTLRYVADLDFWLRAAAAGAGIEKVDELLAFERLHAERLSTAQKEPMAVEAEAMRTRHGAAEVGGAVRKQARAEHLAMHERLLRRFAAASVLARLPIPIGGPWARFLREGRVRVSARRLIGAGGPHDPKSRVAVSSELAAELLGTPFVADRMP
jgi:hypothetical protein